MSSSTIWDPLYLPPSDHDDRSSAATFLRLAPEALVGIMQQPVAPLEPLEWDPVLAHLRARRLVLCDILWGCRYVYDVSESLYEPDATMCMYVQSVNGRHDSVVDHALTFMAMFKAVLGTEDGNLQAVLDRKLFLISRNRVDDLIELKFMPLGEKKTGNFSDEEKREARAWRSHSEFMCSLLEKRAEEQGVEEGGETATRG